jgi:hypothetical protein
MLRLSQHFQQVWENFNISSTSRRSQHFENGKSQELRLGLDLDLGRDWHCWLPRPPCLVVILRDYQQNEIRSDQKESFFFSIQKRKEMYFRKVKDTQVNISCWTATRNIYSLKKPTCNVKQRKTRMGRGSIVKSSMIKNRINL